MSSDREWDKAIDRVRDGSYRKDTVLEEIKYALEGEYRDIAVDRNGNFPKPYTMTPMWFGIFPWFSQERVVDGPGQILAYRTEWRKWVRFCVYSKIRKRYS